MFDWQCPNCGQAVVLNGSAKEQERRREAREDISDQIQDLAAELDTPSYQPSPYSVEELQDRFESILDDVNNELQRR